MAAVSTFSQPRRRRQVTYGKVSRSSSAWNLPAFDGDDDDELSDPTKTPTRRPNTLTKVKEKFPVRKTESPSQIKQSILKPVKASAKRQLDTFDVPSSDEEVGNSIGRRSPPKAAPKRKLLNNVLEPEVPLAPWEVKKADVSIAEKRPAAEARVALGAGLQLQSELDRIGDQKLHLGFGEKKASASEVVQSPGKKLLSPAGGSAAARLKAKKMLGVQGGDAGASQSKKRAVLDTNDSDPTPRKRTCPTSESVANVEDTVMMDGASPACDSAEPEAKPSEADYDIFDFHKSIANEPSPVRPKSALRKPVKRSAGPQRLIPSIARPSPMKMDSAPARLSEMLAIDTDTTEETATRSSSVASGAPSTPQKIAPPNKTSTPEASRRSENTTPKQAELRSGLLSDDQAGASPSVLPLGDLKIQTDRRTGPVKTAASTTLARSSSDVGPVRKRTKLVDMMRASAPSSDNDSSEESDDEEISEDVVMTSDSALQDVASGSQVSQSQSQTVIVESGPRITYARTRSYLPEDSFEDGLMLSLASGPPDSAPTSMRRATTKSNNNSPKSVFDLDDSDEGEGGAGKLRTIHELRAGGGNQRFMDDTSTLLDDIADHNASARSRRRSALVELARKLADSKFLEKFFRQGFEQRLIAECTAPPDSVADFALVSALALLLSGEAPEHAAQSLKDASVVSWLVKKLDVTTSLKRMVKDRANNMSKAGQSTFIDFGSYLCSHETFWGELKPSTLSLDTMALKALDNLVGRLRRSGDRSSLATASEIVGILPTEEDIGALESTPLPTDLTLSVSVLEALCTTGGPVSVPAVVVERAREVLINPALSERTMQRLCFLTLRLSLSLTNDNKKNCRLLGRQPAVLCLLRSMQDGFTKLVAAAEEDQRVITLDLLVLNMGVMINLAEHSEEARSAAAEMETSTILAELVGTFNQGQKQTLEADSVEAGATNVAYGYLAVVLAILCRNQESKQIIASKLPGQNLNNLVDAMEEFVAHHEKVDTLDHFSGDDGNEVWSAFTQKLKGVLARLKTAAQQD